MSTRKRDEPVRLTRIYTRGGDRGETSLGDGSRVPKLDCRIAAFGTVDELNSQLGFVLAGDVPSRFRPWLERIQNQLFDVGADLSVPFGVTERLRVTQTAVDELERLCDELNVDLAADGTIYGIELLNANAQLGRAALTVENRGTKTRRKLPLAG